MWIPMIIIGTFIRGPGWIWFWPGQTWDHNRLIYEVNIDLPDIFGIASNLGKIILARLSSEATTCWAGLWHMRYSVATTQRTTSA